MFVTFIFLLSLIIKFLFILDFQMMTGIICGFYHGTAKKKLDYESNNCLPEGYFAYPLFLLFLISKLRKIQKDICNYFKLYL